jgi:hypothetical protein
VPAPPAAALAPVPELRPWGALWPWVRPWALPPWCVGRAECARPLRAWRRWVRQRGASPAATASPAPPRPDVPRRERIARRARSAGCAFPSRPGSAADTPQVLPRFGDCWCSARAGRWSAQTDRSSYPGPAVLYGNRRRCNRWRTVVVRAWPSTGCDHSSRIAAIPAMPCMECGRARFTSDNLNLRNLPPIEPSPLFNP